MINSNLIFIIGAGSSAQYGFPIWSGLKQEIINYLQIPEHNGNPHAEEARKWLADVSDTKTLDQVISERNKEIRAQYDPSETEALIWIAIATVFFELERLVIHENRTGWIDLYVAKTFSSIIEKYDKSDAGWDSKLIAEAILQLSRVYYVTFNYDRLLEYKINHILTEKLKSDINNQAEFGLKVKNQLSEILWNKFYHPHGIINPYSGIQDNSKINKDRHNGNISHFGIDANNEKHLLKYSPGLMASCFDCEESKGSFFDLPKLNLKPEAVYILGNSVYGLKNNLKKLPCKDWAESTQRIVCTSFENRDKDEYRQIITNCFEKEIQIDFYKTCEDFANVEIT